jgi:2-isopropylmalate synthase
VEEAVRVARNLVADVEFSLTDATRADPLELAAVVRAALSAGARTINVTDGGFILPDELVKLMTGLLRDVPELERAALSFHGHDDLGVAVANAIAAVRAGARQVEVAVDGLGSEVERNTPLDKVVRAVKAHRAILGVDTRVDVGRLGQLSELVRARTSRAKA